MKKNNFILKSFTTTFSFFALFIVMGILLQSCDDDNGKVENTEIEELLTEADLIALMETIEADGEAPKSTGTVDAKYLNQQQKDVILENQARFGNCDPSIMSGPTFTRTITESNVYFTAVVTYDYRFFTNGGVSITDMVVNPSPGFWADKFLLVDNPANSPYSSIFNKFRGFMYAFIATAIEDDVVTQPNVIDYASSGGFIFFGVDNKLTHKCWDASGGDYCSDPSFITCCQRNGYYFWDGSASPPTTLDRYYDSYGYAFIQGGSSSIECAGSGSACGPAGLLCDDISMGFNSHQ